MTLVGSSTIRQNENIRKKAPYKKKRKKKGKLFLLKEEIQWKISSSTRNENNGQSLTIAYQSAMETSFIVVGEKMWSKQTLILV